MPVLPCDTLKRQHFNTKRSANGSIKPYIPHGITKKTKTRKSPMLANQGKVLLETFGTLTAFLNNVAKINTMAKGQRTFFTSPVSPKKRRANEDNDNNLTPSRKRALVELTDLPSPYKVRDTMHVRCPRRPELGGRGRPSRPPVPHTPAMLGVIAKVACAWKLQFNGARGSSVQISKKDVKWCVSQLPSLIPDIATQVWWVRCLYSWISFNNSDSIFLRLLFASIEFEMLTELNIAIKNMRRERDASINNSIIGVSMNSSIPDISMNGSIPDVSMNSSIPDISMNNSVLDNMEGNPLGSTHPFFNATSNPFASLQIGVYAGH